MLYMLSENELIMLEERKVEALEEIAKALQNLDKKGIVVYTECVNV